MTDDPTLKVARDLREISRLALWLEEQATHKASDHLMPGGLAMVALGPVSSPEAWEHVFEAHEQLGRDTSYAEDQDEWEAPLQTLLFWSEAWREEKGAVSDLRPSIASESQFLAGVLGWAYDNEVHYDDFAKDVNAARVRLENLLHEGNRAQRSHVACMYCPEAPRLVKVYEAHARYDHWRCPNKDCRRKYDVDEHTRAYHHQLATEGSERFVPLHTARAVLRGIGRPERTFRQWMLDGKVTAYCDLLTHTTYCFWPDVWHLERTTPKRERIAS